MKAKEYYSEMATNGEFIVRNEEDDILMKGTELEAAMYIGMSKSIDECNFWKGMFLRLTDYIENKNK
jgi:hypothetical protein